MRWQLSRKQSNAASIIGKAKFLEKIFFEQVTVSVSAPVPIMDLKNQFSKKYFGKNLAYLRSTFFYKEKIDKFHQIYNKMWMIKILNEGNQIHNYILDYKNFCDSILLWFRFR